MAGEKNTEKKVEALISPIILEKNLELVDVEFIKEGQNWYLRIYIDKDGGVTIEDCEMVSKTVEVILDEKDPIQQMYILEVSSPGIDRPLKKDSDFIKFAGQMVDVKLYKPEHGSKEHQATLKGLEDNVVTIINDAGEELSFEKKSIASIRLAVIF